MLVPADINKLRFGSSSIRGHSVYFWIIVLNNPESCVVSLLVLAQKIDRLPIIGAPKAWLVKIMFECHESNIEKITYV